MPFGSTFGGGAIVVPRIKLYPPTSEWAVPDDFAGSDTIRIHVDNVGGSDSNNGLTTGAPKQTITAALAAVTPGDPDQILLKRDGSFAFTDYWTSDGTATGAPLSGRNENERMVLGTYGTGAQPRIMSAGNTAIRTTNTQTLNYVAFIGLDLGDGFAASTYIGGVYLPGQFNHVFMEDCRFRMAGYGLQVPFLPGAPVRTNLILRRCNFQDAWGWPQIKLNRVQDFLIEECTIDNTINDTTATANTTYAISTDWNCTGGVVQNNVLTRSSSYAIWMACGGVCKGNVSVVSGRGIQIGNSYDGTNFTMAGGVPILLKGNLVLELHDITSLGAGVISGGTAFKLENILEGEVSDNITSQSTVAQTAGYVCRGIELNGSGATNLGVPTSVRNVLVRKNKIVRWTSGAGNNDWAFHTEGVGPGRIQNIDLVENDFQEPNQSLGHLGRISHASAYPEIHSSGNRFWRAGDSLWFSMGSQLLPLSGGQTSWAYHLGDTTSVAQLVAYPFPLRTIANYNASIGGAATTQDFIDRCRVQTRQLAGGASGWNTNLMARQIINYFEANFDA